MHRIHGEKAWSGYEWYYRIEVYSVDNQSARLVGEGSTPTHFRNFSASLLLFLRGTHRTLHHDNMHVITSLFFFNVKSWILNGKRDAEENRYPKRIKL